MNDLHTDYPEADMTEVIATLQASVANGTYASYQIAAEARISEMLKQRRELLEQINGLDRTTYRGIAATLRRSREPKGVHVFGGMDEMMIEAVTTIWHNVNVVPMEGTFIGDHPETWVDPFREFGYEVPDTPELCSIGHVILATEITSIDQLRVRLWYLGHRGDSRNKWQTKETGCPTNTSPRGSIAWLRFVCGNVSPKHWRFPSIEVTNEVIATGGLDYITEKQP